LLLLPRAHFDLCFGTQTLWLHIRLALIKWIFVPRLFFQKPLFSPLLPPSLHCFLYFYVYFVLYELNAKSCRRILWELL